MNTLVWLCRRGRLNWYRLMVITVPFIIFLGIYLMAVVVLLLFALSSLYHLLKFGFFSPTSIAMTFALIGGTAVILFASYGYLQAVDWSQSLDVGLLVQDLNPF